MTNILALIVGGVLGTVARWLCAGLTNSSSQQLPWGTFLANILGCFLMGLFVVIWQQRMDQDPLLRLLLITGFCGAFTTFSTLMFETSSLMTQGHNLKALGYLAVSIFVGFGALKCGMILGDKVS